MVGFQGSFLVFFLAVYVLAMTGTAIAAVVSAGVGGNSELALQFLIVLFTPQMLFIGYFVTPNLIPVWLRWLQYFCPAAYAVRIILVDEFYQCSSDFFENLNCTILLNTVEADVDDTWWYWVALVGQFSFYRFLALLLLRANANRFY
jgi:ABC-type multidrug transport system permease subunit